MMNSFWLNLFKGSIIQNERLPILSVPQELCLKEAALLGTNYISINNLKITTNGTCDVIRRVPQSHRSSAALESFLVHSVPSPPHTHLC